MEVDENDIKKDPMALMLAMCIESGMEVQHRLINLVQKYEYANIDAIPISEVKDCLTAGREKSLGNDSLFKKLISS